MTGIRGLDQPVDPTGGNGYLLDDGGLYHPRTATWREVDPLGAPPGRIRASIVWTGAEVLVWGGAGTCGARSLARPSEESASYHAAIWTGSEMIIWGGFNGAYLGTGARYDPTDRWLPIPVESAPSPRRNHSGTWSGTQMIVFWGDQALDGRYERVAADGARYDPIFDAWLPLPVERSPSARARHSVWMGTRLVIWGGVGPLDVIAGDGALLDVGD